MSNVRISQLNGFTNILGEDLIPLVDSSSLTTYRVTVTSLVAYMAASGSVLSASWASASISSSYAASSTSSSYSATSSFLNYPNISTASVSLTSTTSSYALSASYARSSSAANSASFSTSNLSSSYSRTASVADTASYFNFSVGVPPFASASISASWASASLSSSYSLQARSASRAVSAETASYIADYSFGNPVVKAFVSFICTGSFDETAPSNNVKILKSYNIDSVTISRGSTSPYRIPTWQISGLGQTWQNFIVKFTNALPDENYIVTGQAMEAGQNYQSYIVQAPPVHTGTVGSTPSPAVRTTTQFSMSLHSQGANRSSGQYMHCQLIVV